MVYNLKKMRQLWLPSEKPLDANVQMGRIGYLIRTTKAFFRYKDLSYKSRSAPDWLNH